MARKEIVKRCVTCKELVNCNATNAETISHVGRCPDWIPNDELARDAREEIEIEFGPLALLCLTPKRQAESAKKGSRHVRRQAIRKAT